MAYLSDELYKTITDNMPIACVDVMPVRKLGTRWEIGIITRATGSQSGKAAILGGRVQHGETVDQAINRHIRTDWGISEYSFYGNGNEFQPFRVQQYLHAPEASRPYGFDPSKHAIALTFLIILHDEPRPQNEASAFYWITEDAIPSECAYNQGIVMRAAFEFLPIQAN